MKRFSIISLLLVLAVPAVMACMWVDTHNYYLFRIYDNSEFKERVDQVTRDNWKAYLSLSADDYFSFNADDVAEAALKKGDNLMASYVRQLQRYLDCVDSKRREQYSWDYPTKEEIAERNATLAEVRAYAQGKLTTRLRSQHALLFMRCNMMLARHGENVTFWEQTASNYIETVYKDMMKNIYAGALLKTGHGVRAGQIFAEQGDWESLMTQYYQKRSYDAICQEYNRDPQSAVLPFLLQDFVNNVQEAVDGDGYGKLFVRNIERKEAMQMVQLAARAVSENKTPCPAMWMSAKAWLEFLYGDLTQAKTDISQATALDGTEYMKDCARILQFYIQAMQMPVNTQYDNLVSTELQWLMPKAKEGGSYRSALDRIIHQALFPKYSKAGRQFTALALLKTTDNYIDNYLDEMTPDSLQRYVDYVKSPAPTDVDRLVKPGLTIDETWLSDLMGTQHLRLGHWKEAIPYLEKVPLDYYNDKGYAIYAANRSYTVEPWVKRQWLSYGLEWSHDPVALSANPKLTFAREMLNMEKDLKRLKGLARQQRCYDLAVRYAQANHTGDCWFITHDGKGAYDKVGRNEMDFNAKAVELLREAAQTSDFLLKEKTLFALAYWYLNDEPWFQRKWSSNTGTLVTYPQPQTRHYQSWEALLNFEAANPGRTSTYIQRCDEYQTFKRVYNKN